jgi:N-dimethylarginine dimethylaminohydrolase
VFLRIWPKVVAALGSDRLTAKLEAAGVEVLTIDYSEVTRIPGSLCCTTLPLLRT